MTNYRGTVSDYNIISKIGEGGYGAVYLCSPQGNDDEKVAVKFTKSGAENISDVTREFDLQKSFTHHNICQTIGEIDNHCTLQYKNDPPQQGISFALEHVPNGSLFDLVAYGGPLDEKCARHYIREMFAGLHHLHHNFYGHRDLKPENVMMSEDFTLKLIDFGFTAKSHEKDHEWCGTEAYMSPKLLVKDKTNILRDDVFATGMILFIMVSGIPPFRKAKKSDPHY